MSSSYLSPGVYVEEVPSSVRPIAGVGTSTAAFIGVYDYGTVGLDIPAPIKGKPDEFAKVQTKADASVETGVPKLLTNWTEYEKFFGRLIGDEQPESTTAETAGITIDAGFVNLSHAVYGFFENGGTRCYVVQVKTTAEIAAKALLALEGIDEVALVAIPGIRPKTFQDAVTTHCVNLEDRFAILDGERNGVSKAEIVNATDSDYGAIYFPWINVFDPAEKLMNPDGDGGIIVPPSGHIAGIYARVDTKRGVHKAPANEVIRGAIDVEHRLSRPQQDGLNPDGVNIIRAFNGNITVWGARTIGGDANTEWKYINVRRLFLFLRESIDEGTQWVVFEPNTASLWTKIERNVNAFLTNIWRAGALFGNSTQEAFYVRCNEQTNPPEVRDQGRVVTEIGVAVAKPAEFVIFRISQWAGPGS